MKTKHVCGKIGGPGNLFGRLTDDANHGGNEFEFIPLHVVTKTCKALSQMIDFMISLPNQISAASIFSCSLKLGVWKRKRCL